MVVCAYKRSSNGLSHYNVSIMHFKVFILSIDHAATVKPTLAHVTCSSEVRCAYVVKLRNKHVKDLDNHALIV